ncbi:MAG TPA: SRPBCC domain-containing protein [Caulobacteraceae bacterium]|jgi:uncharacterized protein YndB with AHSA1/START domain|nr:SRPBCC domain-containing protein [Caulobacteraceae bacterium]
MSKTYADNETIIVDCDLEEPPHKVWRALTEPELLAAWLGPNDIRPEVGHRFSVAASGAEVQCEVLEAEPNRSITFTWREQREEGPPVESQVSWTLIPTFIGGTRLRIVHDGFALSAGRTLALAGTGHRLSDATTAWRIRGLFAGALRLAA